MSSQTPHISVYTNVTQSLTKTTSLKPPQKFKGRLPFQIATALLGLSMRPLDPKGRPARPFRFLYSFDFVEAKE